MGTVPVAPFSLCVGRTCYASCVEESISIIGGGLAGSEAALSLAAMGHKVRLFEMRPDIDTGVHHTDRLAELVCSNSLKSTKPDSAAGMLKRELDVLGSHLYKVALECSVPAGGALAVDRERFSSAVTELIEANPNVTVIREEVTDIAALARESRAVLVASGPLSSDALSDSIEALCGAESLAFFDAAAPIVMADSLDFDTVFRQSRYEEDADGGDYLNAPFDKEQYEAFIDALVNARRVVAKDFETSDLFQACQPIEEIARKGTDAPRFGPMKPVGLTDPRTGKRPWAALQLRAEDAEGQSYNLVGFQTNLAFPEQERVFRMIPGLENAEFARHGVMHRNTFVNAPECLDETGRLVTDAASGLDAPVFLIGQVSGTEGYCEAIRSGLNGAIAAHCALTGTQPPELPRETAFGALMHHATSSDVERSKKLGYQPMHVNFGIMRPLDHPIRNKRERYGAYASRAEEALGKYARALEEAGWHGA